MLTAVEGSILQQCLGSKPIQIDEALNQLRSKASPSQAIVDSYEDIRIDVWQEYLNKLKDGIEMPKILVHDVDSWLMTKKRQFRDQVFELRAHYDKKIRFLDDESTFLVENVIPEEVNGFQIHLTLKRTNSQNGRQLAFRTLKENEVIGTVNPPYIFPETICDCFSFSTL